MKLKKFMPKKSKITIGLIGNPNVGKSTFFNSLTGARQHVGNWPGKTIEKKEGEFQFQNQKIKIVDLPGTYSLSAYSKEETITSEFLTDKNPDKILQIVDAQNLERNLFLTLQLIELGAPLILVLNLIDASQKNGIKIDVKMLSELLGIPIVVVDAKNKKGIGELLKLVVKKSKDPPARIKYNDDLENSLDKISNFLSQNSQKNPRRLAMRLLENDFDAEHKIETQPFYFELKEIIAKNIDQLEKVFGKKINNILAGEKYAFIHGLIKKVLTNSKSESRNFSEEADHILTNKFLGIPIFLLAIWTMFQLTFKLSAPLIAAIELFFAFLGKKITLLLANLGAAEWIRSLIVEGILGGVGGILVFVPLIGILFFVLAILEDSGYLARVAFLMDKLMSKIGLHGKAFIPLILGLGCNVPAILATRTLETRNDRILSILINPFISCGARLPVYALFAGVFFAKYQGRIIFSLYFLGIIVAILAGLIFSKFVLKQKSSPFVIELPPYRAPAFRGILLHVWTKIYSFIRKAGTIILAFSVIIWLLASFPPGVEYGSHESVAGKFGETISPVFRPLGFGNWESGVALTFGFVAKEVVVGTFGTLYNVENLESPGNENLISQKLQADFTPLSAYSFMIFVLLYSPCIAVLAVVRRETNSWKWPIFMLFYTTIIAWIAAFLFYQIGLLLGFD